MTPGRTRTRSTGWTCRLAFAAICSALSTLPVGAQDWAVDLHGGRSVFFGLPDDAASTNASLGLRYSRDHRLFLVGAAVPFSDNLFWAVITAGDRPAWRRGRIEAGVDLFGQAHAQRDPVAEVTGHGLRADLLPVASVSLGPTVVQGRTGASLYRVGGDPGDWSRELWVSELQATMVSRGPYRGAAELRHSRTGDESYTFLGLTVQARLGRTVLWGSVGDWASGLELEGSSTHWGMGVSAALRPQLDAWASLRRDAFDPLYLTTGRRSWGVGVSFRPGTASPRPSPWGPEVRDDGRVYIRLPLAEASAPPAVAGDFTGWEPVLMHRHGGHWRLEISLDPGVYHYAFRSADGDWFVPESVPGRRDDGMGGWVAVLIIP